MHVLGRVRNARRMQSDDQEFIARYEKGRPWEGYADQEVLDRYRQVAPRLTPAEFEQSAQEAVARFFPQDRLLFGQYLQRQAQQQGLQIADLAANGAEDRFRDAWFLGHAIAGIHRCQEDGLEQLLGTTEDRFDSVLAKGALAGIAAAATKISPGDT